MSHANPRHPSLFDELSPVALADQVQSLVPAEGVGVPVDTA